MEKDNEEKKPADDPQTNPTPPSKETENPTDEIKAPPVLLITAEEKERINQEDVGFEDIEEQRRRNGYYD